MQERTKSGYGYKDMLFEDPLLARWAIFFDECGASWKFRPKEFDLGGGIKFCPDFLIENVYARGKFYPQLWVEVLTDKSYRYTREIERFRPIVVVNTIPKLETPDEQSFLEFISITDSMVEDMRQHSTKIICSDFLYIDSYDYTALICASKNGGILLTMDTWLYDEFERDRNHKVLPDSLSPDQARTCRAYKKAEETEVNFIDHKKEDIQMDKPNGFDNVKTGGGFTPIDLGGHVLKIKDVVETKSKSDKDMIVVRFDFADADSQPRYFSKQFADDIRPNKKWPNAGTAYILTEDQDGNCSKNFKTFITSVEKSNTGFEVQWGDNFAAGFKDKLVGGVFGIVEEEYGGRVHSNHKLRWFRSTKNIKDVAVPEDKLLNPPSISPTQEDDFMPIPDSDSETVPFD